MGPLVGLLINGITAAAALLLTATSAARQDRSENTLHSTDYCQSISPRRTPPPLGSAEEGCAAHPMLHCTQQCDKPSQNATASTALCQVSESSSTGKHPSQGVGASATVAQAAMQLPRATLHAMIAGQTPMSAVTVPKVKPAAA